MLGVDDAIHYGVAEEHVGMRHVDLGAQHLRAVGELAVLHAHEQIEILLDRTVAPRRLLARLRYGTSREAYLLLRLVVDVRQALLDELHGPVVKLVEIVRGVTLHGPVESQPLDIAFDRIHVFDILLHGVGVVETQIAFASVFLREAEIYADALGVTYVQIAVRFGRETGLNSFFAFGYRLLDDLLQKVELLFRLVRLHDIHDLSLLCFGFYRLLFNGMSFSRRTDNCTTCCVPPPVPSYLNAR